MGSSNVERHEHVGCVSRTLQRSVGPEAVRDTHPTGGCTVAALAVCLLMASRGLSRPAVVINEVLASNSKVLADLQGDFDDWIELYNAGDTPINVGGMYLSDDPAVPRRWRIAVGGAGVPAGGAPSSRVPPASSSGGVTTMAPKGHLIVWTDGDTGDAGLHASFRLDADGDEIYLFDSDGTTLIDGLAFDEQTPNVSYGRYPDGAETLRFFAVPTPGKPNNEGYLGEVAPLRFSQERGFYSSPFDVTITSETPDVRILYTVDGLAPNQVRTTGATRPPAGGTRRDPAPPTPAAPSSSTLAGTLYTGPIRIGKTTCLRVMAEKSGWKPTPIYTHTYIFESRPELRSLPVVSLVGDAGQVFYEPNGIMAIVGGAYTGDVWSPTGADSYNNMLNRDLERPVSTEWVFPGSDEGFQVDCGLRVHGSPWIRPRYVRQNGLWSGNGKISLRLYFRGEYGQSWLEYPLIPRSEVEQFATVVVRAGHNDRTNPFIQDELLRRLHKDMGQVACTGTFANLFVNGEYKGYYNPTEHVKEESLQQWFGSDKAWDVMTMNGVRDGDSVSFDTMVNYARGHNLADPAYYAELQKKLDVVSFIDYLIIRLWPNDWDWPQNNWSAACERSATGQWKFFVWDAEGTFRSSDLQVDRFGELNVQANANGYLYQALKVNPEFRRLFADRVYTHFYHGGALTNENIQKRFSELREELRSVIPAMNTYIIDSWTPNRLPVFLNACVREGVYTFAGPGFSVNGFPQHGGHVAAGDSLSIIATDGRGTIYYTLDGTDPGRFATQQDPTALNLVTRDMPKRILVPSGPVASDWRGARAFDDSSWQLSSGLPGGVGFGRGSGYEAYIGTNVANRMLNSNASCYLRIPFRYDGDRGELEAMILKIQYDDGFVAYLNATEVTRRNCDGDPAWNSTATVSRDNAAAAIFEAIDISSHIDKLRPGDNLLAIHGLNVAATNSDFLITAELAASRQPPETGPAGPQIYLRPIPLTRTTRVKARLQSGNVLSALADAVFAVGPVQESLRISEIMYHPADLGGPDDPNTEYIELTNIGAETIHLHLVTFTKGIHFTFPDVSLTPGAFCLMVKDPNVFEARYGPGLPVAGRYTGSLSDGGEGIELLDAAGAVIHSFRYRDNWFSTTAGWGHSLTMRYPAAALLSSWNSRGAWRPSVAPGGSPGVDDSGAIPAAGAVVINELLANSAGSGSDWIELHNTTDRVIDVGGWFLSDDQDSPTKYEIAKGTKIWPHGYLVFTGDRHFDKPGAPGCHEAFGLGRSGETVYLHSGAGGQVTGYGEQGRFGPSEAGATFGRYVDGAGRSHLVLLREATPGAANADPVLGPIVITEIMYHPNNAPDAEYVELQNVSDAPVTLYDFIRGAPWRFVDDPNDPAVEVVFPEDPPITLSPRAYLLLVKDRVLFESRFQPPAGAAILEWGIGKLRDSAEAIELDRPGALDNGVREWISVDGVAYSDGSQHDAFPAGLDPWPVQADGQGQALVRVDTARFGADPLNWQAASPSPGVARQRPTFP